MHQLQTHTSTLVKQQLSFSAKWASTSSSIATYWTKHAAAREPVSRLG